MALSVEDKIAQLTVAQHAEHIAHEMRTVIEVVLGIVVAPRFDVTEYERSEVMNHHPVQQIALIS